MAITPFNSNRTREPFPSMACVPIAKDRASICRHFKLVGICFPKISFRVFRCVLHISSRYHILISCQVKSKESTPKAPGFAVSNKALDLVLKSSNAMGLSGPFMGTPTLDMRRCAARLDPRSTPIPTCAAQRRISLELRRFFEAQRSKFPVERLVMLLHYSTKRKHK